MEQVIVFALIVTVLFSVFKFAEIKLFEKPKEIKPLKYFVRDVVLVFVSASIGAFIYMNMNEQIGEFFNVITETKVLSAGPAPVFTDAPGF
jgi:ABC-type anion transport system duplicated permease subunit